MASHLVSHVEIRPAPRFWLALIGVQREPEKPLVYVTVERPGERVVAD